MYINPKEKESVDRAATRDLQMVEPQRTSHQSANKHLCFFVLTTSPPCLAHCGAALFLNMAALTNRSPQLLKQREKCGTTAIPA